MKIAIVSTRGIPNNYGGFEQFAEHISVELVSRGHQVTVYNPHFHPYEKPQFKGVDVVKIFSPEKQIKTAANFIYDFLSLKHAVKHQHDIILCCGYTTAAVSFSLFNFKNSKLVTNTDGLEWKRSKYSYLIQKLALKFESMAIKKSHALISDNEGIQSYLEKTYNHPSAFIPYGANSINNFKVSHLTKFDVQCQSFDVLMARMEPENNIEMILNTYSKCPDKKILAVGSVANDYGKEIQIRYSPFKNITFLNWINDTDALNCLRHYARLYIHGHSVGGTNPSLLEAMAAQSFIVAHGNEFNKSVTGNDALYFTTEIELKEIINRKELNERTLFVKNNLNKIEKDYSWKKITDSYELLFKNLIAEPST